MEAGVYRSLFVAEPRLRLKFLRSPADDRDMVAPAVDTILFGFAAAAGVVIATLASITATIDRHARWAELRLETRRLRRSRQRPGR